MIKKISTLILSISLIFSLAACGISSNVVTKKATVDIDESGIVQAEIIEALKEENAVRVFREYCGEIKLEWTIFGSQIKEVRAVNLSARVIEADGGIKLAFADEETFDFKPMLSVYLNTKWKALNAEVFVGGEKIGTAELTGTDKTVINLTVGDSHGEYTVTPIATVNGSAAGEHTENPVADNSHSDGTNTADVSNSGGKQTGAEGGFSSLNSKPSASTPPASGTAAPDRELSSGNSSGQDKYLTDPVPEGKPMPVEPEDSEIDETTEYTCWFSVECSTVFNNLAELDSAKLGELPLDGIILKKQRVTFFDGESVFDVLKRVCRENGIQMEASFTPMYNSAYVEGINNLYEFDCGNLSGWMYRVDGWYPNYGCSRYRLCDGETVEWRYTCDLGKDVGCEWME